MINAGKTVDPWGQLTDVWQCEYCSMRSTTPSIIEEHEKDHIARGDKKK